MSPDGVDGVWSPLVGSRILTALFWADTFSQGPLETD